MAALRGTVRHDRMVRDAPLLKGQLVFLCGLGVLRAAEAGGSIRPSLHHRRTWMYLPEAAGNDQSDVGLVLPVEQESLHPWSLLRPLVVCPIALCCTGASCTEGQPTKLFSYMWPLISRIIHVGCCLSSPCSLSCTSINRRSVVGAA